MRASTLLGVLLIFGSVAPEADAQSGEVNCPAKGTQLTFSDGGRIEAVSDEGNYVCRFKSMSTEKKFDRLFGAFLPTGPHADQIRSLAPFVVGHKISFTNSGADVRGGDGFWFHDVVIERFENVVTDAGTFPSFVILEDDREMLSSHGEWQRRYWYAPDVGFVVKFQYLTLRGSPPPNYPKDWELTAFRPGASQPAVARPTPPQPSQAPVPPQAPPVPQPASKPAQTVVASARPADERAKAAATSAVGTSRDGVWQMDIEVTTTYGTTVGGECQPHSSTPLTFVNGTAEGPSAKLHLTADGGISGWMQAPSLGTSMLPFIVNVSGRLEDGAFTGSVSGRCIGTFTMRQAASAQPSAERSKVAATAAVPSVPAAVDGIYAGRLAFHIYSAQSAIADIRVSLAGGHATGTITYTSQTFAPGSGSLSLDLSPSGDVTGTGQSQDGFGSKILTIGGHVSGGQIALEITGLSRQSVSTTLSKAE